MWVTQLVRDGFRIVFASSPPLTSDPTGLTLSENSHLGAATLELIAELHKARVIEPVREGHSLGFYSRFFIVPKKTPGRWRAILDLSHLNTYIDKTAFKMETAESVRLQLSRGEWATSLDLSDAYHHVPIHEASRKFLRFKVNGLRWQYRALPMGLTDSARVFTKTVQAVKSVLQREGIRLNQYLDDWLIHHHSREVLVRHTQRVLDLVQELGFLVNAPKSDLTPKQKFVFLGYAYDLEAGTVAPTEDRIAKIRATLLPFTLQAALPARQWQVATGLLVSTEKLVPGGRLRLRRLQWNLAEFWDQSSGPPSAPIPVRDATRIAVHWWRDGHVLRAGVPLHRPEPQAVVYTDASQQGWGGLLESPQREVRGSWDSEESSLHINVKELLAVHHTLRSLLEQVRGRVVMVATDNTTVVAYVNNQGGTRSRQLLEATLSLFEFAEQEGIQLLCRHIPGRLNVLADDLSRAGQVRPTEWTLNPRTVNGLWHHWEKPLIDLFATRKNRQLPMFVSPVPDPEALAVDALAISWQGWYAYAFPPTAILLKVLRKLENETDCTLIVIAPAWPKQQWFPLLLELSADHPLLLPVGRTLLRQPQSAIFHPRPEIFQLHAWRLSSDRGVREAFRSRWQPGWQTRRSSPPSWSTRVNGRSSVIGVVDRTSILSTPMW